MSNNHLHPFSSDLIFFTNFDMYSKKANDTREKKILKVALKPLDIGR